MNEIAGHDRHPSKWLPVIIAMLSFSLTVAGARAEYPERPINGIVPFGVGGPSDIISRIVATAMSQDLGRPIVMLNRPGAGGNVGMGLVANSKPDGYNLLFCSIATTQNPAVFRTMPYDPLKDLMAIAVFGEAATIVAVSATKIPARTLPEFIDLLKKNPPGKYNLGGAGGQRMTMERFMLQFGVKMEIINYKSGGDAATALLTGDIDLQLNNITTLGVGARSGKIRLLAVAGENRLAAFPDVPTTTEAGYPDYIDKAFVGLYANSGTPADIVSRLYAAARRAIDSPEVRKRFQELDYVGSKMTQAQSDAFYRSEIARWKEVVIKANIPPVD